MQTSDETAAGPVLVSLRHRLCLSGVHCPGLAGVCFFSGVHCPGSAKVCFFSGVHGPRAAEVWYFRVCTAQVLLKCATFGRALPRHCRSVPFLGHALPRVSEVCYFWACTAQALPKCASSGACTTLIFPMYCKFGFLDDTEPYNWQGLHVQ